MDWESQEAEERAREGVVKKTNLDAPVRPKTSLAVPAVQAEVYSVSEVAGEALMEQRETAQ